MVLKVLPLFPIEMKKGKKIGHIFVVLPISTNILKLFGTLKGLLTGH